MASNKIIFLDIDGVLNVSSGDKVFVPELNINVNWYKPSIDYINQILRNNNDIFVVVSSTWREFHSESFDVRNTLANAGLDYKFHKDWSTPIFKKTFHEFKNGIEHRAKEIKEWLKKHKDISHFVIIDDMYHDFYDQKMDDNFVHVSSKLGITHNDYENIRRILQCK